MSQQDFKQESAYTRDAFVTPGSGSSLCFYLRTGYCGKLYFNIGKVAVKDYLSLFTRECRVSEHSSSVFVLPRIHMLDMARVLGLSGRWTVSFFKAAPW